MSSFASLKHSSAIDGRVLERSEWPEALAMAQRDPVAFILAITHIERAITHGVIAGEIWGFPAQGPLKAVCWMGANLIPILPEENLRGDAELKSAALQTFAAMALASSRRSSSIVGPRQLVLPLWDNLSPNFHRPREIRASQPSMAISGMPAIAPDPHVRLVRWEEFDLLLPASVHMFIEEVGVSPLSFGSAQYALRVRELIADRRSLLRLSSTVVKPDPHNFPIGSGTGSSPVHESDARQAEDAGPSPHTSRPIPMRDSVAFKADFGAVIPEVAQVQGVWVNPQFRGQGLAAPAVAAVVEYGLSQLAPCVSLYVNDFNHRAIATYKRVGFEQVGEYATVLF